MILLTVLRMQALNRFRRAVYLIRIFSSLCLSIRKYADQDKSRQYDLYYIRDMLPGNENSPTLVKELPITFNKHLFSRDNTVRMFAFKGRVSEDALSVWTNLGKHLLPIVWLCVSSIRTGTRRIIRLDELF